MGVPVEMNAGQRFDTSLGCGLPNPAAVLLVRLGDAVAASFASDDSAPESGLLKVADLCLNFCCA